jgi:DNA polymerase III subunit epsilon
MTTVAVIDVETTGLHPGLQNRIIELAAIIIQLDGTPLREFITLINPERDVGPTRIHRLNTNDILSAPRFTDIAGALIEVLDGCVALVGHNVRFDISFLNYEFARLGYSFPDCPAICTMQLVGGTSLSAACCDYNISIDGEPHSAGYDAQSTAKLFSMLMLNDPCLKTNIFSRIPIVWPNIPKKSVKLLKRGELPRSGIPSSFSDINTKTFIGKKVCFTGESQCRHHGEFITRELAEITVTRMGMIVSRTLTRKVDLLVVADPLTQSTKAKKARQYGIEIIYETLFWNALGLEVKNE